MPEKKLLVVFGATGNQGGSVAHAVLDDLELSQQYSVRAITRDTSNPKAVALKSKGASLVTASLDDPSTLSTALTGVHTLFALTPTTYDGTTHATETRQATALIDAALAAGVSYIIWSSLSSPSKISHGALTRAVHFDVKAEIEQYIRGKNVKAAFFAPGCFMQNFASNQKPRPSPAGDGSYVFANVMRPEDRWPLLDIRDTGAFVAPILRRPDAFAGKFLAAAEGLYSVREIVETMTRVSGKEVKHVRLEDEVWKSYLPEETREMLYEMYVLVRDYGYYGEGMEEQVNWARGQAEGKLVGLEEYLRGSGWKLE